MKEQIDYIYCTGKKERWHWLVEKESGVCTLHITLGRTEQRWRRWKMKCLLRKFDVHSAVIGADEGAAVQLQIDKEMYAARKEEFLRNQRYIMDMLSAYVVIVHKERRSLLIVLEDADWTGREILQCILEAKDHFEDIALLVAEESVNIEHIVTDMYQEWGIAIEVLELEQAGGRHFHAAFFLVKRWRRSFQTCCHYDVAYLVEREMQRESGDRRCGKIFAGLRYKIAGQEVRGDYGRNLAFQKPEEYQKKGVSVVAICERE